MRIRFVLLTVVCFLLSVALGCGKKEESVTQEVKKKSAPAKAALDVKSKKEETKSNLEQVAYHYDPTGKIDPFRSLIVEETKGGKGVGEKGGGLKPLQRYDLDQLKLVGVISDARPPRALFEDVAGDGYIVTIGTLVGKNEGTVAAIHENEVVIEEKQLDLQGKLVKKRISLKMSQYEELEEK